MAKSVSDVNISAASSSTSSSPIAGITTFVQVRRSIVLDAEDQCMQLALAVYKRPIQQLRIESDNDGSIRSSTEYLRVQICLLSMEEDEAEDSGFPTNITRPEDEILICGNGCGRFLYSTLDVQMKDDSNSFSPLARLSCDDNGCFSYSLDSTAAVGIAEIKGLLFEHSETGLQLEMDMNHTNNIRESMHCDKDDDDDENDDDENEESENLDEFENDGFVIGDDEDSDIEGNFSDDDDRCTICNDGGELMICYGGDEYEGCGKSFHAACVSRSQIPEGDWICQNCAASEGIEAGAIGHEFPVEIDNLDSEVEKTHSQDVRHEETQDDSSAQGDVDVEDVTFSKPSTKRRFVLEDSDSE